MKTGKNIPEAYMRSKKHTRSIQIATRSIPEAYWKHTDGKSQIYREEQEACQQHREHNVNIEGYSEAENQTSGIQTGRYKKHTNQNKKHTRNIQTYRNKKIQEVYHMHP